MKDENMEKSGVNTLVWGPKAWAFLHAITFRCPEKECDYVTRKSIYDLFSSLKELLPCSKCRDHYREYMEDPTTGILDMNSSHLSNRDSLSRWLVDLHNDVNYRLGKDVIPYDTIKNYYDGDDVCPSTEGGCSQEEETTEKNGFSPILVVLISFVAVLICIGIFKLGQNTFRREQERILLGTIITAGITKNS